MNAVLSHSVTKAVIIRHPKRDGQSHLLSKLTCVHL